MNDKTDFTDTPPRSPSGHLGGGVGARNAFAHLGGVKRSDLLTPIKPGRSLSGVTPLAVMMKPFNCPGECVYCPLELNMPKSYLSDEPAAQRAKNLDFDPLAQVEQRLTQLRQNGHPTDKLEIIVIGGTFSAYPDDYKIEFITRIYEACNGQSRHLGGVTCGATIPGVVSSRGETFAVGGVKRSDLLTRLEEAQRKNETAKQRIVALSVETRPDWVTEAEVKLIRRLGVTKIQLGVQAIDEEIARLTKRGHGEAEVAQATRLLRNAGMKICYHLMPNLPGSSPEKDIEMSRLIYSDRRFKPDYVKIYPCMVIAGTELFRMWQRGEHRTYSDEELKFVLKEISALTPPWVRVDRLIRDISRKWVAAGTVRTNFRQVVEEELIKEGRPCRCIRCREVGGRKAELDTANCELGEIEYATAGGREVFFSFEKEGRLYALLRLRLPYKRERVLFPELRGAAIVREVHSYGQAMGLSKRGKGKTQHRGLGKRLLEVAEKNASEKGYEKMAVISAIGTREYYRKLGYRQDGLYMVREL